MEDKGAENPYPPEAAIPAEAEKKPTISPRSGADVTRFQFKPGNKGRPAFGMVVTEWYNAMADYSITDLQVIVDDGEQPSAKVAAARQVLAARQGEMDAQREVCDRTNGRPIQQIHSVSQVERVKRIATPAPTRN